LADIASLWSLLDDDDDNDDVNGDGTARLETEIARAVVDWRRWTWEAKEEGGGAGGDDDDSHYALPPVAACRFSV
jgi:hypothetical protein